MLVVILVFDQLYQVLSDTYYFKDEHRALKYEYICELRDKSDTNKWKNIILKIHEQDWGLEGMDSFISSNKSLMISKKGLSETITRMTDNTLDKIKRTNNDLQNTTHKAKD